MKKKLLLTALVITTFNSFAQVNTHSLSFDAIDDYVDVPDNAALNLTGAITIQAWVKANAWGTNVWDNYIVGKDDWSVSSAGYALRAGAGGQLSFNFAVSGGLWQEVLSSITMTTGVWHNVAGTFDGTTQKVYIDGILEGSAAYSGSIVSSPYHLNIGAVPYTTGGSRLFNGNIDEVAIWNSALTASQLIQYKNCPPAGTEAGLAGFWNLEEGTGTTTADNSLNNNSGTLMNGTAWSTDVQAFLCTSSGVGEIITENFSVFPNPANGMLSVVSSMKLDNGVVQLVNSLGTILYREEIITGLKKEINLSNIPQGIYFLKIISNQKQAVQKVIIEH